jgi:DNA-binding NarL/FixJ family response regulator
MKRLPIRILCVDDHALLVEGLRTRFEMEDDLECVGRLPSADDLLSEVKRLKPDIVLLDIEMPGPDPFETAEEVRRLHPETRVIVLSAYVRDHYISAAFKAGVWGFFSKSDEVGEIIEGIRKVKSGSFAFGPKVQERCQPTKGAKRGQLVPPKSKIESLTSREQEVLRLIGKGLSRSEIAQTLSRSPKTIDGHRESIMEKLDIHDRAELVRFAIREGLVEA